MTSYLFRRYDEFDQRKKISKSHQTIDYSDLEYSPQRKGSGESLDSQKSYESQQSTDSHLSNTVREAAKPESSQLGKQWSSTSTTSDPFSESGVTRSAPPHISEGFSKFQSSEEGDNSSSKPQLTRSQAVNWTAPAVKRDSRYVLFEFF